MGQHSSVRANTGQWRGWRSAAIVGVGVGFAAATIAGVGLASGTTIPTPSVYSAITPVTVLAKSLASDSNTDVMVADVDSVPTTATSVQLSVTALDGTTTSSMYVYPTGATKPTSANVRWETGQTITIPVTVAVGTGGKIHLSTDGGTVTVKVALVGYFSPAPAPGSAGYASEANDEPIGGPDDSTTIATLNVPVGTFEVQARADLSYTGSTADEVSCFLDSPSTVIGSTTVAVNADVPDATLSLFGLDTTSAGAMTLSCIGSTASATAYTVELAAIQLSSASGNVSG
jgi:hypothetical protein